VQQDSIYLAIASYRDSELSSTVYSALLNATHIDRIFFYIFSQDKKHPKLESLFDFFGVTQYFYDKEHHSLSKGVGYARSRTQSLLSENFKYYLQVDSHTQFAQDWDSRLIKDYERLRPQWGEYIFSTYPPGYTYTKMGNVSLDPDGITPFVAIRPTSGGIFEFEAKYATYHGGNDGQESAYFCAGLGFGYSKFFLNVPYDKDIYFQGEEHTLSLRFYDKGIRIVCPPNIYLFHDYEGTRRKRNWEENSSWAGIEKKSSEKIVKFFKGDPLDGYGLSSVEKYNEWFSCFVSPETA